MTVPAQVKLIPGLMTHEELDVLCRMARSASSIVELGTYKGRSLAAMMLSNPQARAWAVDWFGDMSARGYKGSTRDEMLANLAKLKLKPAGVIVATTDEAVGQFNETVDLLHIDAGHSYEECLADLHNWTPKVKPGGAVCIHDYGEPHSPELRRPGVQQAVDEWRNDAWVEVERAGTMIAFRHIIAEQGALYVAYGGAARAQARESIQTLKRHMRSLPVAVVSDTPLEGADHRILHVEVDRGARTQKTRMYSLSPYRQTCFLDADTRVLSDPKPGFNLLQYADLVLAQDPVRIFNQTRWRYLNQTEVQATNAETNGGELCYYNSGVIFFRRSDPAKALFQAWHNEWQRWHTQDQPALLRAMYWHPARIATMRAPWNTHVQTAAKFVHHMHHTSRREGAPR